ncbi:MAG: hypothetical protein RBS55_13710, partial [Bacteroidales bacterium]|jgi:hypothetical protein|nr:hypothetical protein [Bacteroidales bacterium]
VADIIDGTAPAQVKETSQAPVFEPARGLELYNNGPLITHYGIGYGGADVSVLQSTSLGMSTLGFGHQFSLGYKIADDFTVTDPGGWNIAGIAFYAYQTNSPSTSNFTAVYFAIYDGDPMLPGSNIVYGDFVTNRMTSTGFTGIYRVTETTLTANNRPIMVNHCEFNLTLGPGTYWLVWQSDASDTYGFEWAPPITITGQMATGNGLQYTTAWGGAYDSGTLTHQQGFPFVIFGRGNQAVIPVAGWALGIGLILIIGLAVLRYRRIL